MMETGTETTSSLQEERDDSSPQHGKAIILLAFDTSGVEPDCDILRIVAKYNEDVLSIYIDPTKSIKEDTTRVHGLYTQNGQLMRNGEVVPTVPMKEALIRLKEWLSSIEKECHIATHSLNFHGQRLWMAMLNLSMLDKFEEIVHGFIDTLKVIRRVLEWKHECSLDQLAQTYDIRVEPRDANGKCQILYEVLKKLNITQERLLLHSKRFCYQIQRWEMLSLFRQKSNETFYTLASLTRVGEPVRRKLADAGINMEELHETYEIFGPVGIRALIEDKIDNNFMDPLTSDSIENINRSLSDIYGPIEYP